MSKRSNISNTANSSSGFLSNMKLSSLNIVLISMLTVVFVVLFFFMPVASVSQAVFDTATGEITVEVLQINGLEALIGNNAFVGGAMPFNFVVLIVLVLAISIIPLNIIANKIVRLVGASIAVLTLSMLFFLPKMLFAKGGTMFFQPTNGLMFLIIILTVATALSINNLFVVYNAKKDTTVGEKLSTMRSAYTEQSTQDNVEQNSSVTSKTKTIKTEQTQEIKAPKATATNKSTISKQGVSSATVNTDTEQKKKRTTKKNTNSNKE